MRLTAALIFALAVAWLTAGNARVFAGQRGSNADTAQQLSLNDVYIAPEMVSYSNVHRDDVQRLTRASANAGRRGVPTKVGIISHYPTTAKSPTQAAQVLRTYMDYSGVLILVTPKGIGMSSDELSNAQIAAIERKVRAGCRVEAADCAINAIHLAVPQVLNTQARANRNAAIFWGVSVGLFGVAVLVLVLMTRRKRTEVLATASPLPPTPTGT
jgi:hypothetical protein